MSDAMPDKFDRLLGQLTGLPDTLHTRPSTIRVIQPLGIGGSSLFIVQTYRQQQRDDDGKIVKTLDTIFLENVDDGGSIRLVLPAQVSDVIHRQRESLNDRSKVAGAKAAATVRKERGDIPFIKKSA